MTDVEARTAAQPKDETRPRLHWDTFGLRLFDVSKMYAGTTTEHEAVEIFIRGELDELSKDISKFPPRGREIINLYCNGPAATSLGGFYSGSPIINWAERLADPDHSDRLKNFVMWHVGKIEDLQGNETVNHEIQLQRQSYKSHIAQGIEDGWLHPAAEDAIKKVEETEVYVGDVFGTLARECLGYCTPLSEQVVIGATSEPLEEPSYWTACNMIKKIIKHEFNHAVLGTLGDRWLDEAITEHIARSMEDGSPETIDPNNRSKAGLAEGIYVSERAFVAHLLNGGRNKIPASELTRAYSANTYQSIYISKLIHESWPQMRVPSNKTFLGLISQRVRKLEEDYKQNEGLTTVQAQKRAVVQVHEDFTENPDIIFNTDYGYRRSTQQSEQSI